MSDNLVMVITVVAILFAVVFSDWLRVESVMRRFERQGDKIACSCEEPTSAHNPPSKTEEPR